MSITGGLTGSNFTVKLLLSTISPKEGIKESAVCAFYWVEE